MLRAGARRNERRQDRRWAKARAARQLYDIQGHFSSYSSVPQTGPEDATRHKDIQQVGPTVAGAATSSQARPAQSETCNQGAFPCAENIFVNQDTSSEDDNSGEEIDETLSSLLHRLRDWAGRHNITHAALYDLLPILKDKEPDLPSDARTLLATPRECPIRPLSNGEYVHFGLKPGLAKCLSSGLLIPEAETLHLTLNIDGLPLFNNSNQQLWPILAMVSETKDGGPFPIGVFSAKKKPQNLDEYLNEFVQEMDEAQTEGIECFGKKWRVAIRAVVCDYPARVYVKSTKGHTGHYGCDKCTQYGVWLHRRTFPETKAPLRTDHSFAAKHQEEHHTGESPFSQLGIGMVSQFPIDYMRLVLLGVVRKFVKYWASGPFSVRRSSGQLEVMNKRIRLLRPHTPSDFSRMLRTLEERDKWKATEARLFLLYACPVVLKGVLTEESFRHFVTLHVAIRIPCTKDCPEHLVSSADQLLHYFVEQASSERLYGETVHVYNVHGLIHLAQDVRAFGPLDSFSSFPFENYLGSLKKKVRSGSRPLAQVYRRLKERMACTNSPSETNEAVVLREHTNGPVPPAFINARQFMEVVYHEQSLKTTEGDN
ncbi:unnamed protein product, partial [Ixodes hexagonus]